MSDEYVRISVPKDLKTAFDTQIKKKKLGYRSFSELAIESIREKIIKLKEEENQYNESFEKLEATAKS